MNPLMDTLMVTLMDTLMYCFDESLDGYFNVLLYGYFDGYFDVLLYDFNIAHYIKSVFYPK